METVVVLVVRSLHPPGQPARVYDASGTLLSTMDLDETARHRLGGETRGFFRASIRPQRIDLGMHVAPPPEWTYPPGIRKP